jgi:hypothetical protein
MPIKPSNVVRLADKPRSAIKSKVRAQFNKLIDKLDAERKRLAAWHEAMPKVRARAEAELSPLQKRYRQCQRELIVLFDAAHQTKKFTKKEREKLADLICVMALDFLEDVEDEEIEALYEHYSGEDELADEPEFMALNDIIEEMLDKARGQAEAEDAQESQESQERQHAAGKSQTKAAARNADEESKLAQSLREIFRKLASALHPDRETDPAERVRKTALMQRANAAYAGNDLLGLLELQFEMDQIDAHKLDSLGEDRIKQYNKVLAQQVDEVRAEIDQFEHWLMVEMQVTARGRLTPAMIEKSLTQEIAELKLSLAEIESDLVSLADTKALKAELKAYRIDDPMDFMDDDFF